MNARPDVLDAITEGDERVPAVLTQLKRLYGCTDLELARAIGLTYPQDFRRRRIGDTKCSPGELAGLARFFDLPVGVFFLSPAEAVRVALERDPELQGPRVVDLREVEPTGAPSSGSTIPGYLKRSRRAVVERMARDARELATEVTPA